MLHIFSQIPNHQKYLNPTDKTPTGLPFYFGIFPYTITVLLVGNMYSNKQKKLKKIYIIFTDKTPTGILLLCISIFALQYCCNIGG